VHTILADNGREFCGTERHPYDLYLALNDIAHPKARVGSPRTNGSSSTSTAPWLCEFFRPALHHQLYEGVAACRPISTPGCTIQP
jgi:hypothetical protein